MTYWFKEVFLLYEPPVGKINRYTEIQYFSINSWQKFHVADRVSNQKTTKI